MLGHKSELQAFTLSSSHSDCRNAKIRLDVVTCAKPRGGNCLLLPHTGYATKSVLAGGFRTVYGFRGFRYLADVAFEWISWTLWILIFRQWIS